MKIRVLSLVILIFTIGCENQNDECPPLKSEQVEQTVRAFLYAADNGDIEKLKSLTTPDFKMFIGDGKEGFDDLVQLISDFPEPDNYDYDSFEFEILTDCNSAFVNYLYGPTGKITEGNRMDFSSHSLYLTGQEEELRIRVLQSTPVRK